MHDAGLTTSTTLFLGTGQGISFTEKEHYRPDTEHGAGRRSLRFKGFGFRLVGNPYLPRGGAALFVIFSKGALFALSR